MPNTRLMLIGLPGSGKTTFLAALWHAVDPGTGVGLRATVYPEERAYLNQLRRAWMTLEPVPRTSFTADHLPLMHLEDVEHGRLSDLVFPDLSGEHFERQWTKRHCLDSYVELVRNAGGAMVFIHPDEVKEPIRLDARDALEEALAGAVDGATATSSEEELDTAVAFGPILAPTATQLVDILQTLEMLSSTQAPIPLAIIISAWDRVEELNLSPSAWLLRRLPLLGQYISANAERFPFRVYGISAQGGDLNSDRARLEAVLDPNHRIRVVQDGAPSHDITGPIRWLLNFA